MLVVRCCLLLTVCGVAVAQTGNDSDTPASTSASVSYTDVVAADHPVLWWRFADKSPQPLVIDQQSLDVIAHGKITLDQPGPRPLRFPLFGPDNTAATFPGGQATLRVKDPGAESLLDFTNGQSLTIEAWVFPDGLKDGQTAYVLGKGRTQNRGVAADNQNYALRLAGKGQAGNVSFLFRGASNRKGNEKDWHRWDSTEGVPLDDEWHHVAVTYTFGTSDSIRGYIDGEPVAGDWSGYGGSTDEAPVVDDDELWIGSSQGGSVSSGFTGRLDEIALYRTALTPEQIRARVEIVKPKPYVTDVPIPQNRVLVEVLEGVPDRFSWNFTAPKPSERWTQSEFALFEAPRKYTPRGIIADRANPLLVWMTADVAMEAGEQQIRLRSRHAARLYVDDQLLVETPFPSARTDGHNPVELPVRDPSSPVRVVRPADQERFATFTSIGQPHRWRLEFFAGGKKRRPEFGETSVSIALKDSPDFQVVTFGKPIPLTDDGWEAYEQRQRARLAEINHKRRVEASRDYTQFWDERHAWAHEYLRQQPAPTAPEIPDNVAIGNDIDRYLIAKAAQENIPVRGLCDDVAFFRRVSLDVLGIPASEAVRAEFFGDSRPDRRTRLIDRLLEDPAWADHWMGYWLDVLAENPNIVNPTLNNTGPFRWWLHESFSDNKPMDRLVTELVLMEGSNRYGGTAGFAVATENDSPLAAKANILSQAFLATDLRCARCHDAPYHESVQRDVFELAALLNRGPVKIPKTSTVPILAGARVPAVTITLKPGQEIAPQWPFGELAAPDLPRTLMQNPDDSREQLAAWMTGPQNARFAEVIVNRMWQRYFGRGLREPVDDFERGESGLPELLSHLSRELVLHDYDLKRIARLILNSHAYQRSRAETVEQAQTFVGATNRRMSAEQVLDSLYAVAGKEFHCEELNVDVDNSRAESSSISLGVPRRAWQFTSLSNERDRPSLSLPGAQSHTSLLEAFGWRGARQDALTVRDAEPSVLQPAVLLNSVAARRIAQLSEDSAFTELALIDQPLEDFISAVTWQILSRAPTSDEALLFRELLATGYDSRLTNVPRGPRPRWPEPDGVSWSNHLDPQASEIRLARAKIVEQGDPPTTQLTNDWRERAEDVVWTLINTPEFVFIP